MPIFQIVHPIVTTINGNSFKEAIKNFVKLNHRLNLNEIILTDQNNYYTATWKKILHDGRNKVGIDFYPTPSTVITSLGFPTFGLPTLGLPTLGLPVSNVIVPSGPIVGPGHDIGPVVGQVISPLSPVLPITPVITNRDNTRIATSNTVMASTNPLLSPLSPSLLSPSLSISPIF